MTSWHKTGAHPFYIGMYTHIYTHIYVHKYTSQKECLHIFHSPEWSAYIYRCQSKITLIKTLVAVPTLGEQHLTQRACACDQPPWTFLLKDLRIFSTFRHRVEVQLRETCRGLAWRPQNVQNI